MLLSHHQPSREFGKVVGILKRRAGKHGGLALAAGFESDVGVGMVLLNVHKGCSRAATTGRESDNQASPGKRKFRNIVGEQERSNRVVFSRGLERRDYVIQYERRRR